MTKRPFMVLALAASLMVVGVYAAPGTPAKPGVTVGDFAVKVAAVLQYDASTPQAAAAALERRGINLTPDLSAAMTQGEATRVLTDLGIGTVAPKNPSSPVSAPQAGLLAGLISTALAAEPVAGQAGLPDQCLQQSNRGNCVDCCKAATLCGPPPNAFGDCNKCSKFCQQVSPPGQVSPSEPTP
jgi:hypothetical protein